MSDLTEVFRATVSTTTSRFDAHAVNTALAGLRERCAEFARRAGADRADAMVTPLRPGARPG
ncbi:hypothetical protein WEH80_18440 [Actinomycetes bacterium KLBMP 9759]